MASPLLHGPRGRTEEQRFMDMHERPADGCWLWKGGVKKAGYGFFAIVRDGKWTKANAHRYAYEMAAGAPIPPDLEVDHTCRQPACVRPDHLEVVTLAENRRRRVAAKTHCKNGHEYTEQNTYWWTDSDGYACRFCRTCRAAASSTSR